MPVKHETREAKLSIGQSGVSQAHDTDRSDTSKAVHRAHKPLSLFARPRFEQASSDEQLSSKLHNIRQANTKLERKLHKLISRHDQLNSIIKEGGSNDVLSSQMEPTIRENTELKASFLRSKYEKNEEIYQLQNKLRFLKMENSTLKQKIQELRKRNFAT